MAASKPPNAPNDTSHTTMESVLVDYANATDGMDDQVEVVAVISYSILMVAAFVANVISIATIVGTRGLRSNPHNLLILNLSVIDLGITILSMSFSVGSLIFGGAFLQENYALCIVSNFSSLKYF